jgi:twitching motility two-component system response regulator PilH
MLDYLIGPQRTSSRDLAGIQMGEERVEEDHSEDRHILIVDDDPDAQVILKKLLDIMGWKAAIVCNGAEALDHIADTPPALILLDLMMPGMNGFATICALKRNPKTREIPVVIISALGSDQRLSRLGADDVLPKGSFNLVELSSVLERAIGKPETTGEIH